MENDAVSYPPQARSLETQGKGVPKAKVLKDSMKLK